ncbi:MAG: hypothetical protein B1H08_01605 [Candidatus Omnitrophica bacterium 4484_171]|nr:MAG: hypothetical protein B1H08_01605 [Candidatus Omnitrophica bacterium 4484_171]
MAEANILILSTDSKSFEYINSLLEGEGYIVNSYNDADSFLIALEEKSFDLILIDMGNKNINGIELCKNIRSDFMLRHIPIILFVEKQHTIEKIKGIYAGADDYIEKPPHADELLTRVKASLWRAKRDLDANPLTKLPGNASISKELDKRISAQEAFCAAYADLDKFKEYNDYYGFGWGDKLIQHTASVIYNAIKELGGENDFIGHIGGDDFIFITSPESIENICKKIIYDFDISIPSFYKEEDRKKGYIVIKNRKGIVGEMPFITISIGVVTTRERKIIHSGQIIQIATELKSYCKTFPKSIYIMDRRRDKKI